MIVCSHAKITCADATIFSDLNIVLFIDSVLADRHSVK